MNCHGRRVRPCGAPIFVISDRDGLDILHVMAGQSNMHRVPFSLKVNFLFMLLLVSVAGQSCSVWRYYKFTADPLERNQRYEGTRLDVHLEEGPDMSDDSALAFIVKIVVQGDDSVSVRSMLVDSTLLLYQDPGAMDTISVLSIKSFTKWDRSPKTREWHLAYVHLPPRIEELDCIVYLSDQSADGGKSMYQREYHLRRERRTGSEIGY